MAWLSLSPYQASSKICRIGLADRSIRERKKLQPRFKACRMPTRHTTKRSSSAIRTSVTPPAIPAAHRKLPIS